MPAGDLTYYSVGPENADPNRVDVLARLLNATTPQQMAQIVELGYWNGTTILPLNAPIPTATLTNVSGSVTSVTLLAANANRSYASIMNDSTSLLYLKLGATASATSFTVKLFQDDYYEVPSRYSGVIDGIWVTAVGAARMTEF